MVSTVENAIAKVLLNANGSNMRPSFSPRKKTGRKEAKMIRSEKKSGRATFAIERWMI